MARKGQTYGRKKANIWSAIAYFKPSLRKLVIRHPGVMRRSENVLGVNEKFARIRPAKKCKGLGWEEFKLCLRKQLKGKVAVKPPA